MKKVLIISYYWPPSGGAGVQRWLKFAKYLPQFGWEPIIYTPENPDFAIEDKSLAKDIHPELTVLKTKIWEPYEIYKSLIGKRGQKVNVSFAGDSKKQGLLHKIAFSIRGNFLIPDPRCFWIKPSVKYLEKYIAENKIDAIITTGPPHSMHIIGQKLHRTTAIPWIADFRDPWTNIDFYKELNLTWLADKIHHKLEKKVITEATCVVSVTPTCCAELNELKPKKMELIYNGYDQEDIATNNEPLDSNFMLVHIGSINSARNPTVLWKALSQFLLENVELKKWLKIRLVGNVEPSVLADIEGYKLTEFVELISYLPHDKAIAYQQSSPILLLLVNNSPNATGILTGKLYEYMASKRPIIAVGPSKSDMAHLLEATGAGVIVDFDDTLKMKAVLTIYFEKFKTGKLDINSSGYEQYSRKAQTHVLSKLLNDLTV